MNMFGDVWLYVGAKIEWDIEMGSICIDAISSTRF
jgi:hypothetical protein